MPRRNVRAVRTRQHRSGEGKHPAARSHFPKLERMAGLADIVRPVGVCGAKLKFDTEENAATALDQAQQAHSGSGHIEKRYYECDKCTGFHLTSREGWIQREGEPS